MSWRSRGTLGVLIVTSMVASGLAACPGGRGAETAIAPSPPAPASLPRDRAAPERVGDITFENVLPKEEQARHGERTSPYVSLADPEDAIRRLVDAEGIVLASPSVVVVVDYPLSRPVKEKLTASSPLGFTRAELARGIARLYQRIYAEEERTARVKTVPRERRSPIVNRNETDGAYGIWGHDLADLALNSVTVYRDADGSWFLELGVDS